MTFVSVKKNPKRPKIEKELRELGRVPSWAECKEIAKRHKPTTPSAVYTWAKKIHGEPATKPRAKPHAQDEGEDVPASESPSVSSPAAVDADFDIEDAHVDPKEAPPPEASGPPAAPPTAAAPTTAAPQISAFPTAPVIGGLVGICNARFVEGGIEPISDKEEEALIAVWDPVAQIYIAPLLTKYGPLIGAGVVTVAVFGPRLMEAYDKKKQRELTRNERAAAPVPAAPAAAPAAPAPEPAAAAPATAYSLPSQAAHAPDASIRAAFGGGAMS
jgi:hypothetical protein